MNLVTISWSSVRSFLRQAAAIVGVVVSTANTGHWNAGVQTTLLAISGAILTAEHYANALNPSTPPQSTATPPTSTGA
jgi:hypothetical protein